MTWPEFYEMFLDPSETKLYSPNIGIRNSILNSYRDLHCLIRQPMAQLFYLHLIKQPLWLLQKKRL
jgi:hypothetical protein